MAKRGPEEQGDQNGKKVRYDEDLFEQRVLVSNPESSVIIGKGGNNVKNIRAESGCFVSLLKNDQGTITQERVMTVKGSVEGVAKALQLVAQVLLEARKTQDDTLTVKLLINKFQTGSVIGKGGVIIKEIQTETGARIQISNDPLGASTEKSVAVTGTPDVLHGAFLRILTQLKANPLRGGSNIPYIPGVVSPMGYAPPPQAPYPPAPYQPYGQLYPPHQHQQQGPPSSGTKTEKIVIPTVCAGTVIGKGGSIISDIKAQSGTQITIADPEPTAPADRVVAITGSSQGIQTAIYLIRQRVENYQPPSGAVPSY